MVIVDVVTERPADLYRELLVRLGLDDPGPGPLLSATAFRPVQRDATTVLDVWREPIEVGRAAIGVTHWSEHGRTIQDANGMWASRRRSPEARDR